MEVELNLRLRLKVNVGVEVLSVESADEQFGRELQNSMDKLLQESIDVPIDLDLGHGCQSTSAMLISDLHLSTTGSALPAVSRSSEYLDQFNNQFGHAAERVKAVAEQTGEIIKTEMKVSRIEEYIAEELVKDIEFEKALDPAPTVENKPAKPAKPPNRPLNNVERAALTKLKGARIKNIGLLGWQQTAFSSLVDHCISEDKGRKFCTGDLMAAADLQLEQAEKLVLIFEIAGLVRKASDRKGLGHLTEWIFTNA